MQVLETTNREGYVALITILMVGVIGVAVASGVLLLGLSWSRTSLAIQQSFQAKSLADACAEDALQRMKDSISYSGNGTLAFGQGSCNYTVTDEGGQVRRVVASGLVGSVVRRVVVRLDKISPSINITSWQEVP